MRSYLLLGHILILKYDKEKGLKSVGLCKKKLRSHLKLVKKGQITLVIILLLFIILIRLCITDITVYSSKDT